jgi:hypothetical protein
MANRLWSFDYNATLNKSDKGTSENSVSFESDAPRLVPASENINLFNVPVNSKNPKITTVNVARDYPWTYSKPGETARAETPKITLTEKRLNTNAFIASVAYSFANAKLGINESINYLKSLGPTGQNFAQLLEKLANTAATVGEGALGTAYNFINNPSLKTLTSVQENVTTGQQVTQSVGDFFKSRIIDNNPVLDQPLLQAYKNLYPTVNTGWQYILPYFEDYYSSSQNIFGDDSNINVLNFIKEGAQQVQSIAGLAGAISHPFGFSFQEKAKFYNFPSEGEEFSFTFPLINTGNIDFNQVVRNWQFIFLLLYQNKPARINRNLVEPPVLYEVTIPGQKFLPFCYITGISVDFKGSRRELKFDLNVQETVELESINSAVDPTTANLPGDANNVGGIIKSVGSSARTKEFFAIIPDAYMIKINLKSLVTETRNFMAYTVLGKTNTANAQVVDIDKTIQSSNSIYGNSNIGGNNIGNQSGANTPVNYTVGGWPDIQAPSSQTGIGGG